MSVYVFSLLNKHADKVNVLLGNGCGIRNEVTMSFTYCDSFALLYTQITLGVTGL